MSLPVSKLHETIVVSYLFRVALVQPEARFAKCHHIIELEPEHPRRSLRQSNLSK